MRFSQRHGYEKAVKAIQFEYVDNELRNGLWNTLNIVIWSEYKKIEYHTYGAQSVLLESYTSLNHLFVYLWHSFFKIDLDLLPRTWEEAYDSLKKSFYSCKWYKMYDIIEIIVNNESLSKKHDIDLLINAFNKVLLRENSAYRIVNKQVVPITDEQEIQEIVEALQNDDKFKPVSDHLADALSKISDKEHPDYRNSIKESISAVEAMCNIITGEKTSLGKALKKLKEHITIHPSLEKGFDRIYGYTSDEHGIRHSMMDEPNVKFEDAKYMLVSCSAFVNYLKQKAAEAGLV